ncbi:unnamed protein product [Ascophyllum nodosum]
MSLPRPGGHFGEKKASSIYSGGPSSTSNAFAAYNAPSATPQHHYNPVASNTPGQAGFSYSGASGSGGGGDGFGTAGAGVPQGFARETPPVGGTPAGGALGRGAGDQWDQYGFSNVGIGGGSGRGSGGMDAFSGSVGSAPGGAMGIGGRAGANQQGAGAGVGGQPPLDWHQWAPPGVNKQVLNMGESVVKDYLQVQYKDYLKSQYQPRVSGFWNTLKVYFTVDNGYVVRKLKVLLFPLMKKDWYRLPSEDEVKDDGRPKFERPIADVNAPDLYVPLMSFITFVLVTGYAKGASAAAFSDDGNTFSPEVLTEVTSSCIVTQLLQVLLIRLGLYLLNSPAVILDLVAYTGYQYVGLGINMTVGICLGLRWYYVALAWTGLMMSFFMVRESQRYPFVTVFAITESHNNSWHLVCIFIRASISPISFGHALVQQQQESLVEELRTLLSFAGVCWAVALGSCRIAARVLRSLFRGLKWHSREVCAHSATKAQLGGMRSDGFGLLGNWRTTASWSVRQSRSQPPRRIVTFPRRQKLDAGT